MQAIRISLMVLTLLIAGAAASGQERPRDTSDEVNPFRAADEKTILVITPHPDDDIVGCGGALAYLSGRHNHVIVVFLTAGEKGTFDPGLQTETVRNVRMHEAAGAYKVLGFPDAELIWLPYPDGELDFAPLREIREQLTGIIRKRRPQVVFALDPGATYFRYHYRDHRAAALLAADAIGAAMWPLEYPKAGPAYKVPEVYYFYTAEPSLKLDITAVYERKLAALAQHRSQFPPALEHYTPEGQPPARADLEAALRSSTGATTLELFRRR